MKKLDIKYLFTISLLAFAVAVFFTACNKDDDDVDIDPNKIDLLSFGPSPVLRGGELTFIGRNMDEVTSVILPDNVTVTSFQTKAADRFTIIVPEETVDGYITLKTPQGDLTTKTLLTISEPIAITSMTPAEVRPGEKITITGTYLNLITEVIFQNKKSVSYIIFYYNSFVRWTSFLP